MSTRLILLTLITLTQMSYAKRIITTLPEFSWVVDELLGSQESHSLLSGQEDPHFIDASPAFVFKVGAAELVVVNGVELEIGWFPKVLQMSGNKNVQPGSKGFCDASSGVKLIEPIKNYDRSMGDVHPAGNPHYSLSLPRMIESSAAIHKCLLRLGEDKDKLRVNLNKLTLKIKKTFDKIKSQMKPEAYYTYHREFNYLKQDFGFELKKTLEEVPGVMPSASYLVKLASFSKKDLPRKVLAGVTSPTKILTKFKEMSQVDFVKLNLHPKRKEDYLSFIEKMMSEIQK